RLRSPPVEITRRRLLSLVPAASLSGLALPQRASATTGEAREDSQAEPPTARLIANTVAMLAGTPESNARPEVAAKLVTIEQNARSRLTAMDAAGDGELFTGLPLGEDDANLARTYQYLYEIALATRAPGSALFDDIAVQRRVLDGLVWLHEHYYGDQSQG